jgi:hypothetical protein
VGCAPRTYLIVDYQVPVSSQQLHGRQVQLLVTDSRSDRYILAPAAARQFEGFQDRYSLAWITPDKGRIIVGEHDLLGLFQATFRKRLESLGVSVVSNGRQGVPVFKVDLHNLKIDQSGRNWVAQMSYTASLSKDSKLIASETVKGSAQRTKIIGRKGADNTLSDIFTDIINRLNIVSLFSQAQMI